ncbi:MAG: hypothetical protein GF355_08490 [Candidatus Eisenbacteria bacterium]|nr:hypothetical protein [Candidatus Eisenbacteria bacterium]
MRRTRSAGALAAGLLLILWRPAGAQPVIDWNDIEEQLDAHPALSAAAAAVETAAGERAAAGQYPNPELGLEYGRAEPHEGDGGAVWGVELGVPILSWGSYRGGIRAAAAELDAARQEAAAQRRTVRRQLKGLFWKLIHAQSRMEALDRSQTNLSQLVSLGRLRVERGEARPLEVTRLEIELARVDIDVATTREDLADKRRRLNLWLGSPWPDSFRVAAELTELPRIPSAEAELLAAAREHPEVMAASHRIDAADARVQEQRWKRLPDLSVGGFYEEDLEDHGMGVTLGLSLPVWNWNSGAIQRAQAAEKRARYQYELTQRRIQTAIEENRTQAAAAAASARSLRDIVLPKARDAAETLERMYQVGEVGVMDLIDARRSLIAVELEMLAACRDAQLANEDLQLLIGG